jgi:hypothetical protein
MFKWHTRWPRLFVALCSIAAFAVAAGAGWRWD